MVDIAKLESAREKLKEWDNFKTKTKRRKRTYLLCGLLYDENGNEFKGHAGTSKTNKVHFYYKCPMTGKTGNAEKLEKAVFDSLGCHTNSEEVSSYVSEAIKQATSNLSALEAQIIKQKEKAKKLLQDERNLASKISSAENEPQIIIWLKEQLDNFEKERIQINESLAFLTKEKDMLVRNLPNVKDMKATLAFALENYHKADPSVQRNCLRRVIQKIVLTQIGG